MWFFLALLFSWLGYLRHCILGLGCTTLIVIIIAPGCIVYEHDLCLVPTMNWSWPRVQSHTGNSVRLLALTDAVQWTDVSCVHHLSLPCEHLENHERESKLCGNDYSLHRHGIAKREPERWQARLTVDIFQISQFSLLQTEEWKLGP